MGILRTLIEGVFSALWAAWGEPFFIREDWLAPWLYGGLSLTGVALGAFLAIGSAREGRAIAHAEGPLLVRAWRIAGRGLTCLASVALALAGAFGVAVVARAIYMN